MALQTIDVSNTGAGGGITYTYIVRVTENSTDQSTNESDVTVDCILKSNFSGDSFWLYTTTVTAELNGTEVIDSTEQRTCSGTGEHKYATWTGKVKHNEDGKLDLNITGKISQASPDYFPSNGISVSGKMTLTDILRGLIYAKVNGVWKHCTPYIKVNGAWKRAYGYIKQSGTWKMGK